MNRNIPVARTTRELVGRFTPTPLAAVLALMERTIRLETNSEALLNESRRAFEGYLAATTGEPRFRWRLVVDSGADLKPLGPVISAFSGLGLRCVNLGQQSFLAVDLEACLAVGFLAEDLVCDQTAFRSLVLGTLVVMTADALGLTPLSAACIARNEHALLVFTEPDSDGLSLSTAEKSEVEDQGGLVTFLDFAQGRLYAWEGCWHLAPHAQFGEGLLRVSAHQGIDQSDAERSSVRNPCHGKRIPLACLFVDRVDQGVTELIRLDEEALAKRLAPSCLIWKEYSSNVGSALKALGCLPAYSIKRGNALDAIATLWRDLLSDSGAQARRQTSDRTYMASKGPTRFP